jgi:hypothetical protein
MSRLLSIRFASLFGLLGSVLLIVGFFMPIRFVSVPLHNQPAQYSVDSVWSMLYETITGGSGFRDFPLTVAIIVFLLSLLMPLVIFLFGLFGQGKPNIFACALALASTGLLEFLPFSALLLASPFGSHVTEIHTPGPGFGMMFVGYVLSITGSIITQFVQERK